VTVLSRFRKFSMMMLYTSPKHVGEILLENTFGDKYDVHLLGELKKWLIRNNVTYPLAHSSSSYHFSQTASQRSRPAVIYRISASLSPRSNFLGFQLCSILKSHIINSTMSVHTTNYCRKLPQVPHGTPNHRNFHMLTFLTKSFLRKYQTSFK
jgi:hypothetical protein